MATANLFQSVQQGNAQAANSLDDIFSQIATQSATQSATLKSAADAQQLVTATEALSTAKQQRQALNLSTQLGTNPDASNEVLSGLIADKNALFQTARSALQEKNRKESTSLFQDPLKWLGDQLTLSSTVDQYNNAAEEYNLVGKRIDDVVSSTDDVVKMTKGIQVSMTDASAQAAAQVARAKLDSMAADVNIAALNSNAKGIQLVQSFNQNQLDNVIRQQQLGMEGARLQLARQSAALEQARMSLALEDRRETLDAKKEGKAEQERTVQAVNLYRKTNGMPEISWTDLKLLYRDPEQKKLMDQQITGGLTIAQTGVRYLADTPVNALMIASSNGAQLAAGPQALLDRANTELAKIKQAATQPGAAKMNPAQVMDQLNANMKQLAVSESAQITPKNTIYAPPSLQTLLADPAIQQTAAAKLVLAPLLTSGVKDFDAAKIYPLLLSEAKKGTITMNQAIDDMGFLVSKSIGYNNAYYSYEATMGLPNMKSYPVKLDNTSAEPSLLRQTLGTLGAVFPPAKLAQEYLFATSGSGAPQKNEIFDLSNPAKRAEYANRYMAGLINPSLKQQAATASKTSTR